MRVYGLKYIFLILYTDSEGPKSTKGCPWVSKGERRDKGCNKVQRKWKNILLYFILFYPKQISPICEMNSMEAEDKSPSLSMRA